MILNLLSKIVPVYVSYTTADGNLGVRARTWHPSWFLPFIKDKLHYSFNRADRYEDFEHRLSVIYEIVCVGVVAPPEMKLALIQDELEKVNCGYECSYQEPYGFVPEDGCPIHDR